MIDLSAIAYKLTGWRRDLPDIARLDALREATVMLCREGRCLRETVVVKQKANDPFVRPFALETPVTRSCSVVFGMIMGGTELPSLDAGNMQNAKFPGDLRVGRPSSFIPLYDGTAMLDTRPDVDVELHVLAASIPVGKFLQVNLPDHLEEAVVTGARYLYMERPGKGQDMRHAAQLRNQFAAYIQETRAVSTAGFSPRDYATLDQAPRLAVIPPIPVTPVDPNPPVDPPVDPGGMPAVLTPGQVFTNGVTGFGGTMTLQVKNLACFYRGWEFTTGKDSITSGVVSIELVRNGVTTSSVTTVTPAMLTDGYPLRTMATDFMVPGYMNNQNVENWEVGDIVTLKVFVNGNAKPCFAACAQIPNPTISFDAAWGQASGMKSTVDAGLTLGPSTLTGQVRVVATTRQTFDSGESPVLDTMLDITQGRISLPIPGGEIYDTGYLVIRAFPSDGYTNPPMLWLCRLEYNGQFAQGKPGQVTE